MSEAARQAPKLLFRPDAFFLKPWKGCGVVRDRRGRPILRYAASGQGHAERRGATSEQTFTFEDGRVHKVEWEITSDDEVHYFAHDRLSDLEGHGEAVGDDFRWRLYAHADTPFGLQKVKTVVLYTLVTPTTAFGFTRTSLWGLPLNTYTTFFEQM
jgi:hypothetical protein